ncbi:MAG: BolA family protein [Noviherbaspirillum sp.]
MSDRIEKIRSRLIATFDPLECQLVDESHLHAGHAGAASGGGHYKLRLVSARFTGLNRIARHRLVYDCLHDMMHSDIHALNIIAFAPSEVAQ